MARWIRQRQGPDRLPLTLHRRRIYIVPSRAGMAFGLALCLMLVAGLNYANSVALLLTFLLGGFALVAMHQCHRNLLGLTLLNATAPPSFAERGGVLSLTFENSASAARYQIAASIGDEPTISTDLPAGGRVRIELPVRPARRGIVRLDRLRLVTRHPFGLFRSWTWVHAPIEMIVYPRPHGTRPMPVEAGSKPGARAQTGAGWDEWLGLRPFRDGDSPRQVDWRAYARGAPLLVKEYSAAGSELLILHFGQLSSLPLEERLEQLARWVVDAQTQGEQYGLSLPGLAIAPDRGPEHRHRCLTALATYGLDSRSAPESGS